MSALCRILDGRYKTWKHSASGGDFEFVSIDSAFLLVNVVGPCGCRKRVKEWAIPFIWCTWELHIYNSGCTNRYQQGWCSEMQACENGFVVSVHLAIYLGMTSGGLKVFYHEWPVGAEVLMMGSRDR